jgi:hypothetical protein
VTKRKNVECVFDAFIEKLAAQANLGLDRNQKLMAKLFAMHVAHGIATKDQMFAGVSDELFRQNGVDLSNHRVVETACQGIHQDAKFVPHYGILKRCRTAPSLLRGHGVTSSGLPVVLPFQRLFGEKLSRAIVQYLVKCMGARPPHQWPGFVMKGEKKLVWDRYLTNA